MSAGAKACARCFAPMETEGGFLFFIKVLNGLQAVQGQKNHLHNLQENGRVRSG